MQQITISIQNKPQQEDIKLKPGNVVGFCSNYVFLFAKCCKNYRCIIIRFAMIRVLGWNIKKNLEDQKDVWMKF